MIIDRVSLVDDVIDYKRDYIRDNECFIIEQLT